jgi:hypothetical protein
MSEFGRFFLALIASFFAWKKDSTTRGGSQREAGSLIVKIRDVLAAKKGLKRLTWA